MTFLVSRHLDDPIAFIKKMIGFAKTDGYVVCIDANREFECCGLNIDGMDYQELCRHDGLEKKWQTELTMQGRDYSVAIKVAHMMQKPGLIDVDVRINDKVEFATPQSADYERTKNAKPLSIFYIIYSTPVKGTISPYSTVCFSSSFRLTW